MKAAVPKLWPGLYALASAVLYGTIGPLSRLGFAEGASHQQIAFLRCFVAFLLLLAFCLLSPARRSELASLRTRAPLFLALSFIGIFCVVFSETWAYSEAAIPLVSVLTYAPGVITLLLSATFLGERLGATKLLAFVSVVAGVYLLMSSEVDLSGSPLGVALALFCGLAYALFLFLLKFLRVGTGLAPLVWLLGFGSLLLAVPFAAEGMPLPSPAAGLVVLALGIFPVIGGFYCTMNAVHAGEAGSTQVIQTSDPLFATAFAFLLFGDRLGTEGWIGAACITAGLLLALKKPAKVRLLALQRSWRLRSIRSSGG